MNYQKIQRILKKSELKLEWYFNNLIYFHIYQYLDNCTLAPIWVKKMAKKNAEEIAMKQLERSTNS